MIKTKSKTLSLWEDSNTTLESSKRNNSLPSSKNLPISSLQQTLKSLTIPFYQYSTICGIDEAGRGCVAGSLFVCGVILNNPPKSLLDCLKDSKVLSQKKRDSLAEQIKQYSHFHLVQKTANEVDNKGLSLCIKESLLEILDQLNAPFYIFDGSCNFKIHSLKTLIKGDSKLHAISAASILAKSAKDAEMQALHTEFPQYDFTHNKGYCTKAHCNAIATYGLCKVHRKTYHLKSLKTPMLLNV